MYPLLPELYYHIAKDSLAEAKAKTLETSEELFRRVECNTTVIVFSALCLEAYINDVYYEHFPEVAYDRISIDNKWLLLPRLLGKRRHSRGARCLFRTLVH